MITLYRNENEANGDWVEAEFKALVVGYRREILTSEEASNRFGPQVELPVITDGEEVVHGQQALLAYLRRLERFVGDWRRFQSDACYVDDQGEVC